ncbi:hypothetical protein HDU67_000412 [Dinochytrium kinnereticum]|nr:hypothetical protein HDU67_000412 [Dinochytrium kinnereticum]
MSSLHFPNSARSSSGTEDTDVNVIFFPTDDRQVIHVARLFKNPAQETSLTRFDPIDDDAGTPSTSRDSPQPVRAICQLYSLPLNAIIAGSSALSTITQAKQSIKANHLSSYRMDGRVHLFSISRHSVPAPQISFVRYRVEGEHVKYFGDIIDVGVGSDVVVGVDEGVESNLTGVCQHDSGKDDTNGPGYWFCSQTEEKKSSYSSWEMPGNMWIHRYNYGYSGNILYSRQLDSHPFRIIKKESRLIASESNDSKLESKDTIIGPQYPKGVMGSTIALMELYAENGDLAVLDLRYRSIDDDTLHFFGYILHMKAGNHLNASYHKIIFGQETGEWTMMKVFSERASLKAEGDEEPPHVDEFHFLTNPVLATSNGTKTVAFVYRSTMHTLDFDPRHVSTQNPSGYVRSLRKIRGLTPTQLRVRGATMDASGETVTFVTDGDSIISMKRTRFMNDYLFTTQDPFAIAPEVAAYFDGITVPPKIRKAGEGEKPPLFSPWKVETLWNAELAGLSDAFGNARVVSLTVVPKLVSDNSDRSIPNGAVGVLYDSGLFILLDPSRPRNAFFLLNFLSSRLEMVIAMLAVVFFFVGTETSIANGIELWHWFQDCILLLRDIFTALAAAITLSLLMMYANGGNVDSGVYS